MRRAARTDSNQRSIVSGLREQGMSVLDLSGVGKGCPDIAVGYAGSNWLFEIKDGSKPPSARRLTPAEKSFHNAWAGQVSVVTSLDDALGIVKQTPGSNSKGPSEQIFTHEMSQIETGPVTDSQPKEV